jgi:hypothetical protein
MELIPWIVLVAAIAVYLAVCAVDAVHYSRRTATRRNRPQGINLW